MEGSAMPGGYKYPPGFRFHPSDQELITHYLNKKVTGTLSPTDCIIAETDLYKFSPWDLPDKAFFGDGEWFFFSPRERKYPNGARPNRAAGLGYWKATGTDKPILAIGGTQCLGVKKALVFYKGRPPKGIKTDWVMNEYRLLEGNQTLNLKHKGTMRLDDWVLCRVRLKGLMPLQGEENTEIPTSNQCNIQQELITEEVKPTERDSTTQWGDYQLLAYLMVGSTDDKQTAGDNSDSGSTKSSIGHGYNSPAGCTVRQTAQISTAKRSLTYGVLDEMMVLPLSKRMSLSSSVGDQMSPSGSFIVDQVYL